MSEPLSDERLAEIREDMRLPHCTVPKFMARELLNEIDRLKHDTELLRGAIHAQGQREQEAGERCGVSKELYGCDWPEWMAEELLTAREEIDRLKSELAKAQADSARYQFIKEHKVRTDPHMGGEHCWYLQNSSGWPSLKGLTLDDAIDSAIAEVERQNPSGANYANAVQSCPSQSGEAT